MTNDQPQLIHLERRTAGRTVEQEFRLSGRIARWSGLGAFGISLYIIGRSLYRYEAFWVLLGALSITLIILSTVGFILDGLTYWRLATAQNIERRDYYPSDHSPAPVQLVHRQRNRLFLTRHKLRPAQWARLAETLAANNWRFTRDNVAKAKVFDKITSRWNDITEDFENRGYIRHDGIRYIVLPHARKLFASYSPALSHKHLISPDDPDDDRHDDL